MASTSSEDTEITLGAGKMLALFFALVALCGLFFGLGFSFGRNSVASAAPAVAVSPSASNNAVRPSAVKPTSGSQTDLTFYKAVEKKDQDSELAKGGNSLASSDS